MSCPEAGGESPEEFFSLFASGKSLFPVARLLLLLLLLRILAMSGWPRAESVQTSVNHKSATK